MAGLPAMEVQMTVGPIRLAALAAFAVLALAFSGELAAQSPQGRDAALTPAQTDRLFRDGLGAYQAGDYARAISHWLPGARAGNANAQSSMGYLYLRGLGVARNGVLARFWYARAAARGEASAQYHLGQIYLHGTGVRRDAASAYMWCDLAMKNGYPGGSRCARAAARNLSEQAIEAAEERGRRMTAGGDI